MYRITICRSTGVAGSVILTKTLSVLYEEEIPDNIDELVEELGGDFYDVVYEEEEDYEFSEA